MAFTILALGMAATAEVALAASLCCQVSSGAQESLLDSAAPGMAKPSLQLSFSFSRMDRFKEGSSSVSLDDLKAAMKYSSLPTSMDMIKYTLTAAYDFNERFGLIVAVPYLRNTMDMTMGMPTGMTMGMKWTDFTMSPVQELGDVTVMGLYHIYPGGGRSDVVTLGLGVKTPTGSSTLLNSSGKFIHAHMQPGSGSWDPLVSAIYTKKVSPLLLQADVTYQLTTRNHEGYEFGDSLTATASGRYALSNMFGVSAALTYLHVNRASDRDGKYTNLKSLMDDPANTGGDSVWFSPGLQVVPWKNSMFDLKVQLPVWEKANGVQLVSRYRVLLAATYTF